MEISNTARILSGVILVTVPSIQFGGMFLLRMIRSRSAGYLDNPVRQNLFRAGHAHAGVIVILSLVCEILADSARLSCLLLWLARIGIPLSAILIPLGFFLSVAKPNSQEPNRWISLTYFGALALAASVLVLGVGLIRAGA